jgi:NAD(P)-dependent dehydrogenase (short-subunit alcohol dehydrogenase family)
MGRMALPSDIADAVLFLASPRASYITAVNLSMDGAQSPIVL